MTDYTQAIDEFCRTYLEGNAANTGDARTKGPLKENHWARDALDYLLIPENYMLLDEKAIYIRNNSHLDGLDYLFLEDPLKQREMLFENPKRNHEEQNIIAHLRFTNSLELEKYTKLLRRMGELTEQEAKVKADLRVAERFSGNLVPGFLLGAMGGMTLYAAAFTYTSLSSFIGEGPTLLGVPLSFVGGAGGGLYFNSRINSYFYNRKSKQAGETSAKLKKDHDCLFQEFRDTFAARFTHGKEALRTALEE